MLRQAGYEVVVYLNDHPPSHMYAFKGGGEAKINLNPVKVAQAAWFDDGCVRIASLDARAGSQIYGREIENQSCSHTC